MPKNRNYRVSYQANRKSKNSDVITQYRFSIGSHHANRKEQQKPNTILLAAAPIRKSALILLTLIMTAEMINVATAEKLDTPKKGALKTARRVSRKICQMAPDVVITNSPSQSQNIPISFFHGSAYPSCVIKQLEQNMGRIPEKMPGKVILAGECLTTYQRFLVWDDTIKNKDIEHITLLRKKLENNRVTWNKKFMLDLRGINDPTLINQITKVWKQFVEIVLCLKQASFIRQYSRGGRCNETMITTLANLLYRLAEERLDMKIQVVDIEMVKGSDHTFLLLNSDMGDVSISPSDDSAEAITNAKRAILQLKWSGDICDSWNIRESGRGLFYPYTKTKDSTYLPQQAEWIKLEMQSFSTVAAVLQQLPGLPNNVVNRIKNEFSRLGLLHSRYSDEQSCRSVMYP